MLDSNALAQVKQLLTNVKLPVLLEASLDDSDRSTKLRELLQEVANQSDLVSFAEVADKRTPSFAITREGTDVSVRFAGVPMGEEFASFMLAIVQVGGHPVRADEAIVEQVMSIDEEQEFVTYMSLTCQNCPTVVQTLNAMSILNPKIRHTAVEGSAFQDEVNALGIKAVPTIYRNGELFDQGRRGFEEILAKITDSSSHVARLNEQDPFDLLVVGGGPAGASAAIYAARKGLNVGVATHNVGGQVLDTDSISNLGVLDLIRGTELGNQLASNMSSYGVNIMRNLRATKLSRPEANAPIVVDFEDDVRLQAKSVLIATGARFRTTGVPGEEEYRNRGVSFCPHCDGPLFAGKPLAVLGGGNSAIEAAIDLAGIASHVTVLEFTPQLNADKILIDKLNELDNTTVITSATLESIQGDGEEMTGLTYRDEQGVSTDLDVNGIFIQIGLVPNAEWLEGTLEMNRGSVVVDADNATSMEGVFAAGDVTDIPHKQIVIALGAGANASLSAFNYLIRN
ncbi:alkyl hydroperoxide reductase subunit F [Trueperella pecoris]|uniref:Alkyl hydroperoxide reductase subunit F n=1 Tax=Trueperella pecoris TaxID=2733571 RepID=A0A7M1QSR6_9ACTO|nr:alkyl hydroperoxide reductase subunit F [Trueperella pecoris]QOQ38605.1 alkyl hydroperoxide reductase subunit F [Trueperella pecoris]QOR44903.1 alkyl hydroperoxide reductase subunit F [Trueperella pecoris]QTG74812.1 alkyl hydroperoxide reductase subunit F [Trueperella pecoris]